MNFLDAKDAFLAYLNARQAPVPTTPRAAVATMLAFYRDVRADACPLKDDSDMLLVQWGVFKYRPSGPKLHFAFNITRQLVEPIDAPEGNEFARDANIYQLYLDFIYPPAPELIAFGKMTAAQNAACWCKHPDDLGAYEAFIHGAREYLAVADRLAEERDFLFERV